MSFVIAIQGVKPGPENKKIHLFLLFLFISFITHRKKSVFLGIFLD